jgi:ABC-type uncharacterized transport system ATPase component
MDNWSHGFPLEKRAVVATLCEPELLMLDEHTHRIFEILDRITQSILKIEDRKN